MINNNQTTKTYKLKNNILQLIKSNNQIRRALEDMHNKSFYTIDRWIKTNDKMLTTIDSLKVISAYLRMPIEQLVDDPEEELISLNKL